MSDRHLCHFPALSCSEYPRRGFYYFFIDILNSNLRAVTRRRLNLPGALRDCYLFAMILLSFYYGLGVQRFLFYYSLTVVLFLILRILPILNLLPVPFPLLGVLFLGLAWLYSTRCHGPFSSVCFLYDCHLPFILNGYLTFPYSLFCSLFGFCWFLLILMYFIELVIWKIIQNCTKNGRPAGNRTLFYFTPRSLE